MSSSSQNPNLDAYIAGLRAFADWLEQNPDIAVDVHQRHLRPLHTNPAVEEFAAKHGLTVEFDELGNASADAVFGPIKYHAYGYVDFGKQMAEKDERQARNWADKNGMVIQPREGGDES